MSRVAPEMKIHSDECVLRQVFQNVDKFLAGAINGKELFTYLYIISKARLEVEEIPKKIKQKDIETYT